MCLHVVFAVIQKDHQVLLVKNRDGNGVERWTLPGGKVEEKETLAEAITREVYEETRYPIHDLRVAYIHEAFFYEYAVHVRAVIFQAYIDYAQLTTPGNEYVEDIGKAVIAQQWVPIHDLPEYMKNEKILWALQQWLQNPQTAHYFFTKDMTW